MIATGSLSHGPGRVPVTVTRVTVAAAGAAAGRATARVRSNLNEIMIDAHQPRLNRRNGSVVRLPRFSRMGLKLRITGPADPRTVDLIRLGTQMWK